MNAKQPNQLIAALSDFVKVSHADAFAVHESLYLDMLRQWEALNRYSMTWADPASKALADRYWQGMSTWFDKFDQQRAAIMEPAAFGRPELFDLMDQAVNQVATDVITMVPTDGANQPVVKINDFAFRLHTQLVDFNQLDRQLLTPVDFELLLEYWRELYQVVSSPAK